ncbi:MAG: 50S ribosomal protein L13 [Bacteroidia bacterium]|nr:50S ribosomal protein L13 [Bacteroidia bacterium]MCZ2276382.1 50S ribosomal protein L13 [Bacteroidia bacterium]
MNTLSYKTVSANKNTIDKQWVLVDAENQTVGRFASEIAKILRGKTKPSFTPHVDCGDNVIIINAEKVRFTGNKLTEKEYVRHTGYPGGQRTSTPEKLIQTDPTLILEYAIHRMLPKTKLGNKLKRNLFIYTGTEHPHQAQQPKKINLSN